MSRETIRDFYNRILGYVETDSNGNKTVRDFYNRILGYYDVRNNVTRDFYNKIISQGDSAVALIYSEATKKNQY